ncbi:sigma 54 modulation/S30EA ribosomal C-terminal domain-containing protein [Streptacidiphilus monticola]
MTAATLTEAVDLLKDRLAARLSRLSDRRAGHGHRAGGRRVQGSRPVEERQIVRRKSFPLPPQSVADALEELEAMDFDFYLFKEESTGADCLLSHADPAGYRIERTGHANPRTFPTQSSRATRPHRS